MRATIHAFHCGIESRMRRGRLQRPPSTTREEVPKSCCNATQKMWTFRRRPVAAGEAPRRVGPSVPAPWTTSRDARWRPRASSGEQLPPHSGRFLRALIVRSPAKCADKLAATLHRKGELCAIGRPELQGPGRGEEGADRRERNAGTHARLGGRMQAGRPAVVREACSREPEPESQTRFRPAWTAPAGQSQC